jgi:hypothetical protein
MNALALSLSMFSFGTLSWIAWRTSVTWTHHAYNRYQVSCRRHRCKWHAGRRDRDDSILLPVRKICLCGCFLSHSVVAVISPLQRLHLTTMILDSG